MGRPLPLGARRELRLGLGVGLGIAIGFGRDWPLAYLPALLVATLLSVPAPPPGGRSSPSCCCWQ